MPDGNGRIKRQARSAKDRPAAPNVIDWLSQQEPSASVRTSQCSTAKFYHACTLRLAHIWKRIQSVSAWSKDDKNHLWETFGRFHLWGKGLPLDLLDSADDQFEETRKLVLELLCDINGLLSDGLDAQPNVDNRKESVISDEYTAIAQEVLITAKDEDKSPPAKPSAYNEDTAVVTSVTCRLDEFDFYLDCLTDLVPTIESAAWGNEILPLHLVEANVNGTMSMNATNHTTLESDRTQTYFILQIRDKFPLSTDRLVQQLGRANLHRFMQIRQRDAQNGETELEIEDSEFIRPALPAFSKFYDSAIGSSLGRQSAHDYSAISHSSFASTLAGGETAHFRVPPTPAEVEQGRPFRCTICGQIQSLKNRVAWKMHVFADLKAYTCTFEECRGTQGPYPKRSTWADHELREHFTKISWTCRFCDGSEKSADTYSGHLQNNHGITSNDIRLGKFLKGDRVITLKSVSLKPCPLCLKDGWSSHRSYFSHVGRHLEEVALAVLPRDVDEEESDSGSSILDAVLPREVGEEESDAESIISETVLSQEVGEEQSGSESIILKAVLPREIDEEESDAESSISETVLSQEVGEEQSGSESIILKAALPREVDEEESDSESRISETVLSQEVDEKESGSESNISATISNTGGFETVIRSSPGPPVEGPASFQVAETGRVSLSTPLAKDIAHNTVTLKSDRQEKVPQKLISSTCSECGSMFEGRYHRDHLRRHLKSHRFHYVRCGFCGRMLSGRSANLAKHRRACQPSTKIDLTVFDRTMP